jgi:hypothetical protein
MEMNGQRESNSGRSAPTLLTKELCHGLIKDALPIEQVRMSMSNELRKT